MPVPGSHRVEFEMLINKRIKTKLKKVGALVVKRAKQLVPVKTGRLKRSIHAEVHESSVEIIADAPKNGAAGNESYAYFVETGEGRGAAQPFLRPALHGSQTEIEEIFNS